MSSLRNATRILVVDDDDAFRTLLAELFARVGYETVEAASGRDVASIMREQRPALVVLDVNLPGTSGFEICRELRQDYGETMPIVLVSGVKTDSLDRVAGLLIGADEYLTKPFDPDELLARVRRLLTRSLLIGGFVSRLTKRELEVLRLLSDGLPSAQIASELYISPKTVSSHIQRTMIKLDVHSRAQLVALAHRTRLTAAGNGDLAVPPAA